MHVQVTSKDCGDPFAGKINTQMQEGHEAM